MTIADIVNEWFQGEYDPLRRGNLRRPALIRALEEQLEASVRDAHNEGIKVGERNAAGTGES